MPGFDHHSIGLQDGESAEVAQKNARTGLLLFVLYGLLYAGFVLLCAFRLPLMDDVTWRGVNLAILYGFGLIFGAFFLALLYCWFCRRPSA